MSEPQKRTGFNQGIFEISSTQKETLGTLRVLRDGRAFRYAKAGASALAAGKLGVAPTIDAAHTNEAGVTATVAVGTRQIVLTVTSGTAIAENQLAGGFLQINDAAGEGHQYEIESNTAITSAGTSITVTLAEPIRVALTTASEFTLVPSPWSGVTEAASQAQVPVGVPPVPVTANSFYWAQTRGVANVLCSGTPAVGSRLTISGSVAGAYKIFATLTTPVIGTQLGTAGVDTEYKPVFLTLD